MANSVLVLAALVLVACVHATPEEDLLRKALAAEDGLARTGTLWVEVYPAAKPVASRVDIAVDGHGHERREHTAGPTAGLIVITDGAVEWRRAPGGEDWHRGLAVGHTDIGAGEGDFARVRANYRLSRSSGEPVAGRRTVQLALTPRQAGNPSQKLWLDSATGLALRQEAYNRDGELRSRITYQSVRYQAPAASEVRLPAGAEQDTSVATGDLILCRSADELDQRLGRHAPRPGTPPAGYTLRDCFLRACQSGAWRPVLTYSDGLNTLTVMETGGGAGGGGGRGRGRGWRWRGGRRQCQIQPSRLQVVVRIQLGGNEYLVIGDHDEDGLEAMATSLR